MEVKDQALKTVPIDTLQGLSMGLLSQDQTRLMATILLLGQNPGEYLGKIACLADSLHMDFKLTYSVLKKMERAGIIEMVRPGHDEQLEIGARKITVLPAASWLS